MKTKIIVNPMAASGSTKKQWPKIEKKLDKVFSEISVEFTKHQNAATHLTQQAIKSGFGRIIAVGGDGTLSEVVNGFFEKGKPINKQTVLGFVMTGTCKDFAKAVGFPTNLDQAIEKLKQGTPRPIDIGKLTFIGHDGKQRIRYFDNIASLGMGGEVDQRVDNSKLAKRINGTFAFLIGTLQTLAFYKNKRIHLKIDDHFDKEVTTRIIAVANGQYGGGGMWFAPYAKVNDGWFDIVIVGDLGRRQILESFSKIYKGSHVHSSDIIYLKGKKITATSDDEVLLDVDGEAPGRLPATFEILPGAINLQY